MSFAIRLQRNNSSNIVADKDLTSIELLNGTLRNETSVTNPTIRIEGDIEQLSQCNYFYIPKFSRYYYLTDIRSIRTGIVEISGHCDVLTTEFKLGNLTNCKGILKKAESTNFNNLLINDGTFRVYQDPIITTKLFPSGFNSYNYVLAVAGSRTTSE